MKLSAPTISIFRRGGPKGVFYAQVNRTTPFSLGTRDPKEAELWKQGKLADLRRSMLGISQHYAVEVEPLTFDEAWTAYVGLRSVQKKAAPTRVGEEITYRLFTEWCRLRGLSLFESVTPALIKEYRRYLQSRPRRGGGLLDDTSVNNYVRDAGVVWKYLTAEEIYNGENPFKSVPKLAVAEKPSKARNWEEVKYVIEASSRIDRDAHLVFVLVLYLGIRRSEILRARWEHIDWDANQITIHKTKPTVMTYTVNLYPDVRDALFAYPPRTAPKWTPPWPCHTWRMRLLWPTCGQGRRSPSWSSPWGNAPSTTELYHANYVPVKLFLSICIHIR